MSNPEAPKDDTTRLEQTVQTEPTDTTEQLDLTDPTRAIDVEEPQPGNTDEGPIRFDDQPVEAATAGTAASAASADTAASAASAGDHTAWPPPVPDRPSGPHAPAIVLGLVAMAVAAIVLGEELGSLSVDWGDVGPLGIVAAGAVLVLFGVVGLLTSRRRANH